MVKKRVKKKVVKTASKTDHQKEYLIAIISIVAIIGLVSLLFFTDTFVGKGYYTENVTDTTPVCVFKFTSENNQESKLLIPKGQTGIIPYEENLINIKVNDITSEDDGTCTFQYLWDYGKEFESEQDLIIGEEYSFYWGNLMLEDVIGSECSGQEDYYLSFFNQENYKNHKGKYYTNNIQYEPAFIQGSKTLHENSCESDSSVKKYSCIENNLTSKITECPEDYSCAKGVCFQCVDNQDSDVIWMKRRVNFSLFNNEDEIISKNINDFCKDNQTFVNFSCSATGLNVKETTCSNGCYYYGYKSYPGCFDGCTDSDSDNIKIKGNITGLELKQSGDNYYDSITSYEDGCSGTKVVEHTCAENGKIIKKEIECPEKMTCVEGACIERPALVSAQEWNKDGVRIEAIKDTKKPFWIIITTYDKDNSLLSVSRTKSLALEKYESVHLSADYPDSDQIYKKTVQVYDIPDPSNWTVYLNETFVMEYDEDS
jgi:hypothetical protein